MKETRRTFLLYGYNAPCQVVLDELTQFAAIVVLPGFSRNEILNVYTKNKCAAIWMGERQDDFAKYATPLPIYDGTGNFECMEVEAILICIGTKFPGGQDNTDTIDPTLKGESIAKQFKQIASKHNVDVGDLVQLDKALLTEIKAKCQLCAIAKCNGEFDDVPILFETKNFIVTPALGCLAPGYVMVLPKKHTVSCIADMNQDQRSELLSIVRDVKTILSPIYGSDYVMFEQCGENSISHCCLHVIPTNLQFNGEIQKSGLLFNPLSNFDKMDNYQFFSYYLLFGDQKGNWFISATKDGYIPSQYIRKLLAKSLKLAGSFDDTEHRQFRKNIVKTVSDVSVFLENNYAAIPDENTTKGLILHIYSQIA